MRDSGIGISKEMLPNIFDMFAQERQALDRSPGGLGLGLAIVRTLITMHGGTVTAHSEGLGRGSELVIELPASTPLDEAPCSPPRRRAGSVTGRKILLVDDNGDAAELTADALIAIGHEVRVAYDGPSAFAIVASFAPEVVLLDIGLPVMDGYEVAERLRTLLWPHQPRFIAITGYGQAVDYRRSEEAGFDSHLVKPVGFDRLRESIAASMRMLRSD